MRHSRSCVLIEWMNVSSLAIHQTSSGGLVSQQFSRHCLKSLCGVTNWPDLRLANLKGTKCCIHPLQIVSQSVALLSLRHWGRRQVPTPKPQTASGISAQQFVRKIAEKVPEAAIGELQQYAALFPLWPRYALQQLILPCARSSSGKRDVSITETQQNQRTRKAK
jgi:hypothetical protein